MIVTIFNSITIIGLITLYVLSILWYFSVVYPYATYTRTPPFYIFLTLLTSPLGWLLTHSLYGDDKHYKQVLKKSYELHQLTKHYRYYDKRTAILRLKQTYAEQFLIVDYNKCNHCLFKTKLEIFEKLKNQDSYFLLSYHDTIKFFKKHCSGINIFGDETELKLFIFDTKNLHTFAIYNITNSEKQYCDKENVQPSTYDELLKYINR